MPETESCLSTAPARTPVELGSIFANRWAERALPEQLEALLASKPRAPRYLDGELLRYAEKLGVDTWENDAAKHAVRAGFWEAITAAATG